MVKKNKIREIIAPKEPNSTSHSFTEEELHAYNWETICTLSILFRDKAMRGEVLSSAEIQFLKTKHLAPQSYIEASMHAANISKEDIQAAARKAREASRSGDDDT